MKRSNLTRKTELKRTGFRRKPKVKGTPQWFKKKVVEAMMASFRGKPCAICGKTEGTCAHHILPKGSTPHHIATRENLIPLCQSHHRFNRQICPHSSDPFVVNAFLMWLAEHREKQYEWCMAHKHDTAATCGKIDWQARYEVIS